MACELIAVDIGGTNARFCRATIRAGEVPVLDTIRKYRVANHAGLADAWRAFAADEDRPLPTRASIALAAPVQKVPIKLTNSHWVVDPAALEAELGITELTLINDFGAIAHGISALPRDHLELLFGPDAGLPREGAITVVGPGTGLGVAAIAREAKGVQILSTEGGHIGFAPVDGQEERLIHWLRERFGRVSVERVVSGPGLNLLYQALGEERGAAPAPVDDGALWQAALAGEDALASDALAQLCRSYGSVSGDLALAHGPHAVVLAGALTARMKAHPAFQQFHPRFSDKGRHRKVMDTIPVYYAAHPELGLFGAAVAGQAHMA